MNHEPSSPCHFCTPFCLGPKAGRARADPRSHWRGRSGRSAVRPARWRHHFCHCRQPGQGAAPARHGSEVHHQQPRCQGHWMVMWSLVFFWGLGRFLWGGSRSFGESEGFGWLKNKNVMIIWKSVRVLWLCITNQEDISGRWLRPLLKSPRLPKTMLVDSLLQDSLLILRHGVGTLPLNDSFWLVIWKIMFFFQQNPKPPPFLWSKLSGLRRRYETLHEGRRRRCWGWHRCCSARDAGWVCSNRVQNQPQWG